MKDMIFNKIEFIGNERYLDQVKNNKKLLPEPIKFHVPDWYKNLKHHIDSKTVKGCMPFLDTLTAGYSLKLPVDYQVKHNFVKDEKRTTSFRSSFSNEESLKGINLNKANLQTHPEIQVEGSPEVKKNLNLPIHKFLNPWVIKTPPGYSCLFLPPMNNTDERFSIIPGIVDTDTFKAEINFPFVLNGDKFPILDTLIELGTPYVQVIPFKREQWKMKVSYKDNKTFKNNTLNVFEKIMDKYKNTWWRKKKWI
jgi:hypothetical protein